MPAPGSSTIYLATPLMLLAALGCSATTSGDGTSGADGGVEGGSASGLAPGSPCPLGDAGPITTACRDNPVLPTCYQCVDLTEGGMSSGVCAYTCRIGKDDCPPGQTCTMAGSTHRTSFQPCRDLTGGVELGYCK